MRWRECKGANGKETQCGDQIMKEEAELAMCTRTGRTCRHTKGKYPTRILKTTQKSSSKTKGIELYPNVQTSRNRHAKGDHQKLKEMTIIKQ